MEFKKISDIPGKYSELIGILKEGNKRFTDGEFVLSDINLQREKLLKGQNPRVIVLTCSDSRVVPEYIFEETIGELFVIRNAGNVVGVTSLGSIEYAAAVLNSQMLLIMGHESCGAIHAAFEGGNESPNIEFILNQLEPAVRTARMYAEKDAQMNTAIYENVKNQMNAAMEKSKIVRDCVNSGSLAIVGAVYNLHSGMVDFIDECIYI